MSLKKYTKEMSKNSDREPIELTCFKMFLKVVAKHRHFALLVAKMPFVFGVPELLMMPIFEKRLLKRTITDNAMLYNCRSLDEVLSRIMHEVRSIDKMQSCFPNDAAREQSRIANIINALLHYTIERSVGMDEIQDIGKEIFNNTCRLLYGDDFKDETPSNCESPSAEHLTEYFAKMGMDIPQEAINKMLEKMAINNIPINGHYSNPWSDISITDASRPQYMPNYATYGYSDYVDDDDDDYPF